jgi:hypothetical protein
MGGGPPDDIGDSATDGYRVTGVDEGEMVDAEPDALVVRADDRAVMRARLAAMAAPRAGDSVQVAGLRAILRDQDLMAHVLSNVEQWPALSDDQRDVLGSLLQRSLTRSRRRAA